MQKLLNKLKTFKIAKCDKKFATKIGVAFIAIVTGLTSTSYYLNLEQEKQRMKETIFNLPENAIRVSDEEVLAGYYDSDQYTKISDNIYVVNDMTAYEPAPSDTEDSKATVFTTIENQDEINQYYTNAVAGMIENPNEEMFEIASENNDVSDVPETNYSTKKILIPSGKTLKEFCTENGLKLVAVIDTGVSETYAAQQVNFTDEDNDATSGHGDLVAQQITANANGKAVILSLKAFTSNGKGTIANVMKALQYARDQQVDVINMSFSTNRDENNVDKVTFENYCSQLAKEGITMVAAAGNNGEDASGYIPATVNGVTTVGAMNEQNIKLKSSNYGDCVNYYEIANSTSEAAGVFTGKLVNGNDLSGEITNGTITIVDSDKAPVKSDDFILNDAGIYGWLYSSKENEGTLWLHIPGAPVVEDSRYDMHNAQWFGGFWNRAGGRWTTAVMGHWKGGSGWLDYSNKANDGTQIRVDKFQKEPIVTYDPDGGSGGGSVRLNGSNVEWSIVKSGNNYITQWVDPWTFTGPDSDNKGVIWSNIGSTITTPTRVGYTFDGWSETWARIKQDRTIKAKWKANNYTITFDSNGGTGGPTTQTFAYNSGAKITTSVPSKAGYTFRCWTWGNSILSPGDTIPSGWGNFTLTAQWDKDDAGTVLKKLPEPKIIENYQYDGKTKETAYEYFEANDATKYGQSLSQSFADVTYNGTNGSTISLNSQPGNEKLYIPINTTAGKTYTISFDYTIPNDAKLYGWNNVFNVLSGKPKTGKESIKNDGDQPDDDKRLYITGLTRGTHSVTGKFTATTDKTYLSFGLWAYEDYTQSTFSFSNMTVTSINNPYTLSTPPTRAGYEFLNWNTQSNGSGTKYKAGDKVKLKSTDTTYYAQWKALITESPLNVNLGIWSGSGYTYAKNANGLYNNKETTSQKGYKVATVDYKAIFEGGTSATTKQNISENKSKVQIDSTVNISNLTMMNGYKFEGWIGSGATSNTSTSFKVTPPDSNGKSTNETTLKARGVSYNVVFHNNSVKGVNGTPDDDQTVLAKGSMNNQTLHYGSKETLNANQFTWEGHRFLGWSATANGTSVTTYNGTSLTDKATGFFDGFGQLNNVHEDGSTVHLYAVWETLETTVKLEPTSLGSVPSSQSKSKTAKWGSSFSFVNAVPNNISATLTYDFNTDGAKWSSSQPSGVSTSATSGKTDKSKLEFKEWIITDPTTNIAPTDNNGSWGYFRNANTYVFGAKSATLKAEYYFTKVILPKPEKTGYEFIGWYYDKDYSKFAGNAGDEFRATDSTQSTKETLYAKWTKNTYGYTDVMDYQIMDKVTEKVPHVWIRKISTAGKVLTTVDTPLGKQGFVIKISEGSTYNENKVVLVLDTSKGILDKNGNVKIALNGVGYDKTSGFYDISALLEPGKTYTAHEAEAAAGWSKDVEDKTFTCQGVKSTLNQAKAELAKAKADLDKASNSEELKKAQAAYDKALKNVETIENAYVNISFKDEQMDVVVNPQDLPWKLSSDGSALAGAKFDLYDLTLNRKIWSFKTNEDGNLPEDIKEYFIAGHTIKFAETNPPYGCKPAELTATVPERVENYNFLQNVVDEDNTAELCMFKADNEGKPIKGTVFKLFVKDNNGNLEEARYTIINGKKVLANPNKEEYNTATPYAEVTTDANGITSFGKVRTAATYYGETSEECTKSYYVQETKASEGYALNSDIIQVTLEDIDNSVQTFDVHDNTSVSITLPTGGKGSSPYYIYGFALMMASLLALRKYRKIG